MLWGKINTGKGEMITAELQFEVCPQGLVQQQDFEGKSRSFAVIRILRLTQAPFRYFWTSLTNFGLFWTDF